MHSKRVTVQRFYLKCVLQLQSLVQKKPTWLLPQFRYKNKINYAENLYVRQLRDNV